MEASSRKCPILLRQVAARRRVSEVVFGPLLVDALLTTHPAGFRVFFRSERNEASSLLEAYNAESAEKLLDSRVRFSLAHEIAHTLFYDLSKPHPEAKQLTSETELDDLEDICNILAGHLLMPSELLKLEVPRLPNLKPEAVLGMAVKFGVAPTTAVVRLDQGVGLLTMKHDLRGCIVALMDTSNGLVVSAIARPRHINIPVELSIVRRGELWQVGRIAWSEVLSGKQSGQIDLSLTVKTQLVTEQKNYVFEFARHGRSAEGDFYLATVDLAEPFD